MTSESFRKLPESLTVGFDCLERTWGMERALEASSWSTSFIPDGQLLMFTAVPYYCFFCQSPRSPGLVWLHRWSGKCARPRSSSSLSSPDRIKAQLAFTIHNLTYILHTQINRLVLVSDGKWGAMEALVKYCWCFVFLAVVSCSDHLSSQATRTSPTLV